MSEQKQVPSIGRMVHYVLTASDTLGRTQAAGEHRPAVIVRVWTDTTVNLLVFCDGESDGQPVGQSIFWRTSVVLKEDAQWEGTWHWMEYVPPKA